MELSFWTATGIYLFVTACCWHFGAVRFAIVVFSAALVLGTWGNMS